VPKPSSRTASDLSCRFEPPPAKRRLPRCRGKQQKVVFARGLAADCRILLIDEPTRGVDVGAKREIHDLIRKMASQGAAVLVFHPTFRNCSHFRIESSSCGRERSSRILARDGDAGRSVTRHGRDWSVGWAFPAVRGAGFPTCSGCVLDSLEGLRPLDGECDRFCIRQQKKVEQVGKPAPRELVQKKILRKPANLPGAMPESRLEIRRPRRFRPPRHPCESLILRIALAGANEVNEIDTSGRTQQLTLGREYLICL